VSAPCACPRDPRTGSLATPGRAHLCGRRGKKTSGPSGRSGGRSRKRLDPRLAAAVERARALGPDAEAAGLAAYEAAIDPEVDAALVASLALTASPADLADRRGRADSAAPGRGIAPRSKKKLT
jgi:hypothetical protein